MKQNKKEVCAIILARSGSKGLKNKNLRDLDGKPLISYTINDAKKSHNDLWNRISKCLEVLV